MIRILLVDDNAIVRRGIASLLAEADGLEVVGEAGDGREAIAKAEELRRLVCLDVRMPAMDGVAAAGALARALEGADARDSEDEHLVTGAIRNGAAGYLVHGRFEPEELEGRIKAVARGEMVLSPGGHAAVFDVLRRAPGPSNDEDELGLGSLTARERKVLNLLARGNSNREIAEELVITNKTVKNHLSRIYEKIGVHSRAEAIALWLGVRDQPESPGGPEPIWTPGPPEVQPSASRRTHPAEETIHNQSVDSTPGGQRHVAHYHHSSERLPRFGIQAHGRARGPQRLSDQRGQTAAQYMGILFVVAVISGP